MHLCCHTCFSFKYGIFGPEKLLQTAAQKGLGSLAITDINNTSGIADFFRMAPHYNIHPVAGIDFRNGMNQVFSGIAQNMEGFHELNRFLSHHLNSGEPFPKRAPAFNHSFVIYPFAHTPDKLCDNEFIGISPSALFQLNISEWKSHPDKLVALAPVTFRNKTDYNTHRLLRAIDNNTLLSKLPQTEQAPPQEVMYSADEMQHIYRHYPQLLARASQLLEQCYIDFEFGKNKNKKYFLGSAKRDHHKLMSLCYEGLSYRYPNTDDTIIDRFEKEIQMIGELGYSSYFLINHDIVRYAQSKNYFYVGRGSGANSMVAYLLRITDVDPIDLDLYFERFINPQRTSPPDFDIDFSWNERDDVIDYIFNRSTFGREHVALLATYSTFQRDAAIRELGKVFGLPKAEIDSFFDHGNEKKDPISRLVLQYAQRIIDLPAHLSIHAGGILISEKPMTYYTALDNPPKGFPLTQFSMLEAEDLGLYKFDILSQRGLGKVKDAVIIIEQNQNIKVDIHNIKRFKEDEAVRHNLEQANLMGCFYVESPAMRMLLKKLKAKTYLDLVAASSIIRPGVAQSGMMREYIMRFHDISRRTYIHPMMEELMRETFGVMVYQEDVIKVAHYFAGLTLTEADMLRRGMSGKYRGRAEFEKVKDAFFKGCAQKGHAPDTTAEVWRQIESFAGYAFSKGHSASYAVESYQCMFLKTFYPLEYMVACINNGGGFYAAEFYVHEARLNGGIILAPDVNHSAYETTINGKNIYLGFHLVGELETKTVENILKARTLEGSFTSLAGFMQSVEISLEQLRLLIRVNALRFTGRTKQQLLWDIHEIIGHERKTCTARQLFEAEHQHFTLPELHSSQTDDTWDEIEMLGFPLCSPFELLTAESLPCNEINFVALASELPQHCGRTVAIAGYFVTRKPTRTKHGQPMAFGTFLDRNGQWIDTTLFPNVVKQYPFRGKGCYRITGKVVQEFGFYSIDVTSLSLLPYKLRFADAVGN
ncbi:MAG TPA: DNA polymerase III subunit alpha [Bacteroidia bacterium]|jgi:DNA-directed DNA polymerase III PolC|nr:DNA polymerase III subunit alpha [Bacteroidia bacterium]HMU20220.1 DNA polymerase III subunit alpha [Bacteroidia bacterium]